MPIYADIGISTGAYANFSLAAALLRIAEIAPAAEILSLGRHSLLDAANARVIELAGLPFTVHGPFLHFEYGSRSGRHHRKALDEHRRQLEIAGELGARVYVLHPDLQRKAKGWDARVVSALESSFEALALLQQEYGVTIAVENLPFVKHTHFRAPGDLDLRGLGLSLDVGHAAVTGTLSAWLSDDRYLLKHVHLHDNEGHVGGDQHLPLGRGVIDAAPGQGGGRARRPARGGAASSPPRRSWSWPAPSAPRWCSSTRTRPTSSRACATCTSAGSWNARSGRGAGER